MIDISKKIGLPIKFDNKTLEITFGEDVTTKAFWKKNLDSTTVPSEPLWKSLKFASIFTNDSGEITKEPNLKKFWDKDKLYYGYRSIYFNDTNLLDLISKNNLIPDITILPSGAIENEYIRTEGHEHLSLLPEVYEVILGEVVFLIFKTEFDNKENIEDIIAVFAKPGDHVVFPPGYQHISVNIGEKPLVITDWNSTNANSDFRYIKKHNGAPYWIVKGENGPEFLRNPKYKGKVPEIRLVKPSKEIPELGLKKDVPMFNLVKEGKINMLEFLNDTSGKYNEVYKKAFVPLK